MVNVLFNEDREMLTKEGIVKTLYDPACGTGGMLSIGEEYVKELLVYGELSLSEIAMKLEYSSIAHLSGQFKKITGLTPSHYKKVGQAKRKTLDQV